MAAVLDGAALGFTLGFMSVKPRDEEITACVSAQTAALSTPPKLSGCALRLTR